MIRVLVGSRNPTKTAAVEDVFGRCFGAVQVIGLETPSGVAAQPVGLEETFAGAENRARALVQRNMHEGLGAHFCVGIEGGVVQLHGRWFAFGVVCIADAGGRLGFGVTSHFELPYAIAAGLAGGVELGEVIDELTGLHDTRSAGGAIGFLSAGRLDRQGLAAQGVFMALLPFFNAELFFSPAPSPPAGLPARPARTG